MRREQHTGSDAIASPPSRSEAAMERGGGDPDPLVRERAAREAAEARARSLADELERVRDAERAARAAADAAARARDQFISSVSHDLRGPIGTVLTWAQLLRGGLLSEEKRARAIEAIERGARAQVRLLESLVDLARLRAGTLAFSPTPTELAQIARAAIEKASPSARAKGVEIDLSAPGEALSLRGDPERLAQAVSQLLDNAVRATPDGGRVGVRLRRDGGHLEVEVRDDGAGFEPGRADAVLAAARDPDAPAEGKRGLGLALAVGLVERHAGMLSLYSDGPGLGTTAVLRLPAPAAAARRA